MAWYTIRITVVAHDQSSEEESDKKAGSGVTFTCENPEYYHWEKIIDEVVDSADLEYNLETP